MAAIDKFSVRLNIGTLSILSSPVDPLYEKNRAAHHRNYVAMCGRNAVYRPIVKGLCTEYCVETIPPHGPLEKLRGRLFASFGMAAKRPHQPRTNEASTLRR
jgi:hypothetical protein